MALEVFFPKPLMSASSSPSGHGCEPGASRNVPSDDVPAELKGVKNIFDWRLKQHASKGKKRGGIETAAAKFMRRMFAIADWKPESPDAKKDEKPTSQDAAKEKDDHGKEAPKDEPKDAQPGKGTKDADESKDEKGAKTGAKKDGAAEKKH